ncbi:MAG: saccharopine dehydrogenase C-terminal domain-containing protein [Planctomycetota bacterium]
MEKTIAVLGAGLVGGPLARDLAAEDGFEVTVADVDGAALSRLRAHDPSIDTMTADLSDAGAARALAAASDLVVSAVPGHLGFATLRAVIEAGTDVVDIAFFPEDPFELDSLAKERGVTAVVDAGVAPGLSNLLVGRAHADLDETEEVLILVGGLPVKREWPYEYKAGFSPIDVIEEYTRPARYVQGGEVVTRPALSEPEPIDFEGVGTLEAFNTDGLRTLAATIDAPDMKEKTLRYPGHIEKMAVLRETGFFDAEPVDVDGAKVRPIDLTAALLFPMWKLGEGEADLTAMRITVAGRRDGQPVRRSFRLLDRYEPATGVHSMARTTGYTATAIARLLLEGRFAEPGVVPPEFIGRSAECVDFVLARLGERGVVVRED